MGFIRPFLMGGAYVAVADDASVLFYNPAGLAALPVAVAEVFGPQINVDDLLRQSTIDPTVLDTAFADLSAENFEDFLGETFFSSFSLRLPFIFRTESGVAFGLGAEVLASIEFLKNPVLPGVRVEFFSDTLIFLSMFYKPTDRFYFGWTPKFIRRVGIDKTFSVGELFASGGEVNVDNDPAMLAVSEGVTYDKIGVDLGFLYKIPHWPGWFPRVGMSVLNVGGMESGKMTGMEFGPRPNDYSPPQAGELPQINTIGFAVSPVFSGVRYTIAADLVDFTKTVLPGDNLALRSRIGLEVGFGGRDDGAPLVALLAGFNATHPSFGIMTRVSIFQIGFGIYTVEMGQQPGDQPDTRAFLLFSIRI